MEPPLSRDRARSRRKLGLHMRRLSNLWRNLIRKDHVEKHLDAELRSYLELLEQEKISKGIDPQTAHREALMELGGMEQLKESVREARAGGLLKTFGADCVHACRVFFR